MGIKPVTHSEFKKGVQEISDNKLEKKRIRFCFLHFLNLDVSSLYILDDDDDLLQAREQKPLQQEGRMPDQGRGSHQLLHLALQVPSPEHRPLRVGRRLRHQNKTEKRKRHRPQSEERSPRQLPQSPII